VLMAELRKMDAAQLFVYVRRVRMWAALVFDWALEHPEKTGVTINPAALIKPEKAFGKAPVKSHPALGLTELPDFLRRLAADHHYPCLDKIESNLISSQQHQRELADRVMSLEQKGTARAEPTGNRAGLGDLVVKAFDATRTCSPKPGACGLS
jgi:hypothetical protein